MRKSLLAILALLTISSVAMAGEARGFKVRTIVANDKASVSVYNGSLFTIVCSGVLAAESLEGEIVVKEIKKLVVSGDKTAKVTLESDLVMVDAVANIKCYQ